MPLSSTLTGTILFKRGRASKSFARLLTVTYFPGDTCSKSKQTNQMENYSGLTKGSQARARNGGFLLKCSSRPTTSLLHIVPSQTKGRQILNICTFWQNSSEKQTRLERDRLHAQSITWVFVSGLIMMSGSRLPNSHTPVLQLETHKREGGGAVGSVEIEGEIEVVTQGHGAYHYL